MSMKFEQHSIIVKIVNDVLLKFLIKYTNHYFHIFFKNSSIHKQDNLFK